MRTIEQKEVMLEQMLDPMEKVIVAFSGGVDSSLVLRKAIDVLGVENVRPVVVKSELFRETEFEGAAHLAEQMGTSITEVSMKELSHPMIVANGPDSWYYSKKKLYKKLNEAAKDFGTSFVLDGMIVDDEEDFRPGLKARTEANVKSVLQTAGFCKEDVRTLSKHLQIPVWDKPASCSLASRVPYGEEVTLDKIIQINQAELFIMELGFPVVRVRHHGEVARIEVKPDKITALTGHYEAINEKLKSLGFKNVVVDLEGYYTGRMNEVLSDEEKNKYVEQKAE